MVISKDAINTLVSIQPASVSHATQNTTQSPHPFSALPNGTVVEGYVIKRDGQNNPILRTQAGDVLVTTDVFLKTGTEVTLRVDNAHPNHARIVTINGLSPDAFSRVQALSVSAAEDSYQGIALQQANGATAAQAGTPKPVQIHGVLLQAATQNVSSPAVLISALQVLGINDNARRAPLATQAATSLLVTIETIAISEINDTTTSQNNKTTASAINIATQSQNISAKILGNSPSDDIAITSAFSHSASSISAKSVAPIQAEILRAANSTLSTIDTVENLLTEASVKPLSAYSALDNVTVASAITLIENNENADTSSNRAAQSSSTNKLPSKPAIANTLSAVFEKNTQNVLVLSQTNLQSFDGKQVAIPAPLNTSTPSSSPIPAPALTSTIAQAVPQNLSTSSPLISSFPNEINTESADSQTTLEPSGSLIKTGNEKAIIPQSGLLISNVSSDLPPALTIANSLHAPSINQATAPFLTQAPVQSQATSAPSINTANFNQNQIKINSNQSIEVPAQVIGRESGGDTIVQTPVGVLKLFTEKPLHVGSVLTLSLSADNSISNQKYPSSLSGDLQELTHLARDWDSLAATLRALGGSDPQLAATILNDVLPNTGKSLTHGILFFLTALKGGDVRGWFGNKTSRSIDDKLPELLSRLGVDFKALQQASIESTQQGWLSTIIPLLHEQTLHQARLFIRHEQEKEGQHSKKPQGNRFIIEVDMTQLGEIQFDGYVSKDATRHQFDMMIRTTRPLPLDIQQNIRTIYQNAGEITGFTGMLQFQNTPESFVRPLSEMKRDDLSGLIV